MPAQKHGPRDTRALACALLATATLLASSNAATGETPLSLAEALERGRAGAREVSAAAARQRAAEARAREARSYRLPQVRLSEQWIRTDSPADAFGLLLNQERFSFADFVAGDPNDPATLEAAITRLEVELPIWTGGELATRVEQARLAAEAAAATTGRAGDLGALGAAEAWIRLAQAREAVALLETSHSTVAAHVDLAARYVEQGMLVRSDLLRAEVERANLEDHLAEARGNARIAESGLAFRFADPGDSTYDLLALAEPPALARDLATWLLAAEDRRDLAAARHLLAAGDLEARALRGGLLPRVGLLARHDRVDDQPFAGLSNGGESTTIAAMASLDLFDGGRRRAAIGAARAEAEAARADLERFAEGVRLEVRHAYEAALVAIERRGTAASALGAAGEALRIVEERFGAGIVRTTDVLDAAQARREAQMRELVARAEAWLAHLRLAVAAGDSPESILPSTTPSAQPSS